MRSGDSQKAFVDLGWPSLLEQLAARTHTGRGAEAARGLELLGDPEQARARIALVDEARRLRHAAAPLPFGGIVDIEPALGRAARGATLEAADLIAIGDTAHGCYRLREHTRGEIEVPGLAELAAAIEDLGHVFYPIRESFDADGELVDHASDALGTLRRKVRSLRAELESRARALVESKAMQPLLQDQFYTQREDRYVLPIKVEARSRVGGIVHGTSQSGQTVFIEPEALVNLNNRLKLAECEVADEERRILRQLTGYVAEEIGALRAALCVATELDLVDAAACMAQDLAGCAPVIDGEGVIDLHDLRHPLMVLSTRPCVPNDVAMAPRSILIVSGPNAGGKTVALKSVGLAALMVRAGLHVAARAARLPWFTRIRTDIGDSQSIEKDLSTFSAHVLGLRGFLEEADTETLLLIDEIAVGTEPEQGAALAEATLEALAGAGATAIVTTHYEGLKALAARDDRFANASVGFDFEKMEPTFRLRLGAPGSSGALNVARRLGLPGPVLDRAAEILGDRRAGVEELLATLEEQRRILEEERSEAARARLQAEQANRQAEAALAAAREREKRAHRDAHNQAIASLKATRAELEQLKGTVLRRKARAKPELKQVERKIDQLSSAISSAQPERELPEGKPARAEELEPGTPVFVIPLGARGEVAERPSRGKVGVQVGAMRTSARVGDLLVLPRRQPKSSPAFYEVQRGETAVAGGDVLVRTEECTCDVRGERVEEAVSTLDRFIDASLLAAREVVFVIHGHGTGALRSAIRAHAESHPTVASWRAGEQNEGGDGVTVMLLQH